MTFGEKVRSARRALGITQEELASLAGVSQRSVCSYEKDASRPRGLKAYQRLADALQVNINFLLSEDEAFIAEAEDQFGYRGKTGAQKLMQEVTGLFAGGEMAEEDMDELMFAIQTAYIDAKKRNKKYARKDYADQDDQKEK